MRRFVVKRWPSDYTRLWPDRQRGPWRVTLQFAVLDGAIECVGLDLTPAGDPERLSSETLRKVAVASLMQEAHRELAEVLADELVDAEAALAADVLPDSVADDYGVEARDELRLRPAAAHKPKGRTPYDDSHYREVAQMYLRAYSSGAGNPTQQVAEQWPTSRASAARWVARARQLGHLPPAVRGKAGFRPE